MGEENLNQTDGGKERHIKCTKEYTHTGKACILGDVCRKGARGVSLAIESMFDGGKPDLMELAPH